MNLREFLEAVITVPPFAPYGGAVHALESTISVEEKSPPSEQWFCLALAPKKGVGWWEEWFKWPDDIDKIMDLALTKAEDCNVYFSTYLFKAPQSTKDNVLPTRTIQADLDAADILTLPIQPSILVETSNGRHQGYWFIKEKVVSVGDQRIIDPPLEPDAHEVLSRKLTYSIPNCDTSGWPLGRKVRMPGTFNYKYLEGPQQVKVISSSLKQYDEADIELLPDPPPFLGAHVEVEFLDLLSERGAIPPGVDSIGPQALFAGIKTKLPVSVQTSYNVRQPDRSKALWALLCSAFRQGLTREQVWWLGWNSANNKFGDLEYHAERELAKDVLRAEGVVKSKLPDERGEIDSIRKQQTPVHERRQEMLQTVIRYMRSCGEFIHTTDDMSWYIRNDLGRPIRISSHSEWLDMILDLQFGLNGTETDKQYVATGLSNFCRSLPINGVQSALSYYDPDSQSLLLHTWRKDVIRITADSIARTTDGSYGIVFPWGLTNEAFNPQYSTTSIDWADILFGSALDNVIGIEPHEARALLKVWLLFLLFRNAASSRPILAFFGQPGAGKSTLFRRIYCLLYGRLRSVQGVSSPENFDQAVSASPFIVLDNVDMPEKWLPDRLALSASTSDIEKRKLYTDSDDFVLRRQALIGITAHNPHFNREDVADRLLLLTFKRLERFDPEGDILLNIYAQRNKIWGAVVQDCQKVLQQPHPAYADTPQFRVEDFARTGYWIASALGIQEPFAKGLTLVGTSQKELNLEEHHILVTTLQVYIKRGKGSQWQHAAGLWADLMLYAPDSLAFQRVYRNAVNLGKKLFSLQDSLKKVFDIEYKYDKERNARIWRINGKEEQRNNGVHGADSVGLVAGRHPSA